MLATHREALAEACRRLAGRGLVEGTAGNVSVREGDHVAVTPTGADLGALEPDQVPIVDMEGRVVAGELEPTSELFLHLGVYEQAGAGAVVHTHAPMATALACVVDEVPLVHYSMLALGGPVRVAPYATFGTPELARNVAEALEGRSAALMQNHGAVSFGPDLPTALTIAELLEWNCGLYWRARAIGEPATLDAGQLAEVAKAVEDRGYGATRSLDSPADHA